MSFSSVSLIAFETNLILRTKVIGQLILQLVSKYLTLLKTQPDPVGIYYYIYYKSLVHGYLMNQLIFYNNRYFATEKPTIATTVKYQDSELAVIDQWRMRSLV